MNQTESVEAHMNVERATGNKHGVVGDMGVAMARGDLERATTPLQAEPDPIEVLIVDDHPMVREGLAARISAQPVTATLSQGFASSSR